MRIVLESAVVVFGAGLPDGRRALAGVDLSMSDDEFLAVIGPTGAGKTSLLEVAAGLLSLSSGRAFLDEAGSRRSLRSGVGLVYQFPELQFFEETVYDDVAFGPRRLGLTEEKVDERVRRALSGAGLSPEAFSARAPISLSAGEKRRAAIAGILALERPFLLLDEPTAGLDPASREGIIGLLSGEGRVRGVVVVSHDLDLVDRVATRTVVMNEGAVVADGPTRDVLSRVSDLERMGLAPPARHVLLERIRSRAPRKAARVEQILFPSLLAKPGAE